MMKPIRLLLLSVTILFAVSCADEQPVGQTIGAKTQFDQTVLSTSQSDLDVIDNWQSGTTRGNEFWKIRRVTN